MPPFPIIQTITPSHVYKINGRPKIGSAVDFSEYITNTYQQNAISNSIVLNYNYALFWTLQQITNVRFDCVNSKCDHVNSK